MRDDKHPQEQAGGDRVPISDAFRESFLCGFSPKVAAVFRQFVDGMEELALDRAGYLRNEILDALGGGAAGD